MKHSAFFSKVTSIYLAVLLTLFLFFVGPTGYQSITGTKHVLFLILSCAYVGLVLVLLIESVLLKQIKLPPVKELLFADAVVRDCRYDGDAVFWTGNSSLYEEGVHLYRYDLRTRENTVLLANFEKWVFPVSGDWLYYADKTSLQKIHKETGEVRLACQTDSITINTGANGIREVGEYISVQAHDGENTGRLVYHPRTGEAVFYPISE